MRVRCFVRWAYYIDAHWWTRLIGSTQAAIAVSSALWCSISRSGRVTEARISTKPSPIAGKMPPMPSSSQAGGGMRGPSTFDKCG